MGPKRPQNRADSVLPCARNRGAEPFWPKSGVNKNARARAREGLGFLAYFSGAGNRSPNAACGPADRGSGATQRARSSIGVVYWNLSVSSASSTVRRTRYPRQPATKITTLAELGEQGPEGLLKDKHAIVVETRGGVYTTGPRVSFNHQE